MKNEQALDVDQGWRNSGRGGGRRWETPPGVVQKRQVRYCLILKSGTRAWERAMIGAEGTREDREVEDCGDNQAGGRGLLPGEVPWRPCASMHIIVNFETIGIPIASRVLVVLPWLNL